MLQNNIQYCDVFIFCIIISLICCMCIESESHSVLSDSSQCHGLYSPWISPGQNTGVGSPSFLQEIFPTQGSGPDLPHCRQILHLTHVLNVKNCPYNKHSSFIYTGSRREAQQRYRHLTSIEATISFK